MIYNCKKTLLNLDSTVEIVENGPSVMLVYPHGCVEMENIVIFLTSQLNTFGIKVLSDIVQSELIAEQSLPKVLIDNFNKADYVVMLCIDNIGRFFLQIQFD